MPSPSKILVIRPEKLGDLVVATPTLRALRNSFPDAVLTVLTDRVHGEILKDDPFITNCVAIDWKWRDSGQHEPIRDIVKKVRESKYDLAIVLYPNWAGWNWIAARCGIPAVIQVGGTWLGALLGHQSVLRRNFPAGSHYRDFYLAAAELAGARLPLGDDRNPRLFLETSFLKEWAERFPRVDGLRRIIVHPFGHGSSPNYSKNTYVTLIERLTTLPGLEVWITGGRGEAAAWNPPLLSQVRLDWLGTLTLREMMAACASVDAVVCGSTGVIHMAAALGTPTIGVFCPHPGSHPAAWGPLGPGNQALLVPGSRCRKLGATDTKCLGTNDCDLVCGISIEQTLEAVRRRVLAGEGDD